MALEMKWSEGEYRTGDPKSDMGAIVVHLWNGRYHEGFVAKIGRTSWGHHSKWEVLGEYQNPLCRPTRRRKSHDLAPRMKQHVRPHQPRFPPSTHPSGTRAHPCRRHDQTRMAP